MSDSSGFSTEGTLIPVSAVPHCGSSEPTMQKGRGDNFSQEESKEKTSLSKAETCSLAATPLSLFLLEVSLNGFNMTLKSKNQRMRACVIWLSFLEAIERRVCATGSVSTEYIATTGVFFLFLTGWFSRGGRAELGTVPIP